MNQCSLCFEPFEMEMNPAHSCIPCGHVMCLPCLETWFRTHPSRTCPLCRVYVDNTVINRAAMDVSINEEDTTIDSPSTSIFNITQYSEKKRETLQDKCQFAFYVIDNSLSMEFVSDGKIYIKTDDNRIEKTSQVDRWEEAKSKILQIARYNIDRNMTAAYYLLNPENKGLWIEHKDYIIVDPTEIEDSDYDGILDDIEYTLLQRSRIKGNTPLDRITQHLLEYLEKQADYLQIPICYNIITDGEPNNKKSFEIELSKISKQYNVFLTINLCTDNHCIIDYYNELDGKIGGELSGLDVIDDYESEKGEVWKVGNRFFNYSIDIHICRMAGCYSVLADWMDETELDIHFVSKFVREITNTNYDLSPAHYMQSRQSFIQLIKKINNQIPQVYDINRRLFVPMLNSNWLEYIVMKRIAHDFVQDYRNTIGIVLIAIGVFLFNYLIYI